MAYGMWKVGVVTLGLCGAGALAEVGCGSDASGVSNAKLPDGVHSSVIEHEPCTESGNKVEILDVNNDRKPDIKRVTSGGREICRITDLNRDGKPDMFEYYDKAGQLRRREADYDDNGVVNAIEHFEGGKLVRREVDTTNHGRIDTWDFFDPSTGNRTKRERDANGDGKIDQWWSYEGGQVTIAIDRNSDGQPEPESTVVLSSSGAVIASDAGVPGVPSAIDRGGAAATASADGGGASTSSPTPAAGSSASSPASTPVPAEPTPPLAPPSVDAGIPGKPQRGGAKR